MWGVSQRGLIRRWGYSRIYDIDHLLMELQASRVAFVNRTLLLSRLQKVASLYSAKNGGMHASNDPFVLIFMSGD